MAREFAQTKLTIWTDEDFLDLSPAAQHLYFVLKTSPSLSYAGVADWRPNRIAAKARGWTLSQLEAAADELIEGRFIVVDEDTEEVLVRSFVRHDGLMKQPKMATAMASALSMVASRTLRGVVVHELRRLRDHEPELKGWASDKASELLDKASVDPSTYPLGKGLRKGSVYPLPTPKPKGSVEGSAKGSPTPVTTTTTTPSTAPIESLRDSREVLSAQDIVGAWIDVQTANGISPSKSQIGQVAKMAKELLLKNDHQRVLAAARSAAAKGFSTIDRELTAMAGQSLRSVPVRPTLRDPRSGIIVER
jgi:hypothetical protein